VRGCGRGQRGETQDAVVAQEIVDLVAQRAVEFVRSSKQEQQHQQHQQHQQRRLAQGQRDRSLVLLALCVTARVLSAPQGCRYRVSVDLADNTKSART
jgi:hypothetical protein